MIRLAAPFNLTGLPAVSIPYGFSSELPVGLQIVGELYDKLPVLTITSAYERATNWKEN